MCSPPPCRTTSSHGWTTSCSPTAHSLPDRSSQPPTASPIPIHLSTRPRSTTKGPARHASYYSCHPVPDRSRRHHRRCRSRGTPHPRPGRDRGRRHVRRAEQRPLRRHRRHGHPGARRNVYPTATLQSTANGTSASRIHLQPYGSESVKIDGSNLPDGDWIFKLTADYWTVSNITFQNSPDSAVVCQSCASTVWSNIKTINGGDSGFTLTGDSTTNNTVKNIDSYGHYDAANHGENADGIAVKYGSGSGNLITGARLYNNSDDGLDFWSFSSPVTVEHTWAMGNGKNRWSDSAFAGDGNGYKLGGDGETVAHVINNSAAWDNAGNGFTENSNKGAIVINRTTAYANAKWGYYFATGAGRLGRNLAVSNSSGSVNKGSSVVSSGNNWDWGSRPRPSRPRTRRRRTTPVRRTGRCPRRRSSRRAAARSGRR